LHHKHAKRSIEEHKQGNHFYHEEEYVRELYPTIETVAKTIAPYTSDIPFVLDPVMFAKGGHPLLEVSATETLIKKLLPLARIITPNIPEAEHLSGMAIRSLEDMKRAAEKILGFRLAQHDLGKRI
jgi:hydroxymethylpyrimidine kinase/phosphomethylpyrimidine kinase